MDYSSELTVPFTRTFPLSAAASRDERFFCDQGQGAGVGEREFVSVAFPGELRACHAAGNVFPWDHRVIVKSPAEPCSTAGVHIGGEGRDIQNVVGKQNLHTSKETG